MARRSVPGLRVWTQSSVVLDTSSRTRVSCRTRRSEGHGMWSWNRTGSRGAYLVAYIHDHPHADKRGRIYLHRAIMENHLGRMLARTELVHHKDRDPRNNEVDNLEVMSVLEHNVEHHSGREDLILECGWCGVKVVRRHGQRNGQNVFCSRSHSAMFYGRGVAERHDYGAYRRGCRCQVCREANAARIRSGRSRTKR